MKNIFSKTCLLLCCVLLQFTVKAQDSHQADTDRPWFLPDHAVAQFAGGIGMVSAGFGYSYLKDKVQTDILYGYAPPFDGYSDHHILTIKTSWHPWRKQLGEAYLIEPLRLGSGLSYSYGSQFYTKWPTKYPDGYYWWATTFRLTPFLGTAISREINGSRTWVKRVQVYGEIGSNDLYLISSVRDKGLPLWQVLNLAFGTKLVF